MSSAQDPTKPSTAQETEKEQDTVAETIAYARRTYKGNHPDAKTFEPEKYVAWVAKSRKVLMTAATAA